MKAELLNQLAEIVGADYVSALPKRFISIPATRAPNRR